MLSDLSECKKLYNFRYEFFDTIVSTNDECMKRALSGDLGNLWIIASRQTSGRGRGGKKWVSDKGNLYASLLLIDSISKDSLTLLSFAVSVAMHSIIASILPAEVDVKIKWPNDLLVFQRKIAGILIETLDLKSGLQAIVIGIGLNVEYCPKDTSYPVTSLRKEGGCIDLKSILPIFFQEIAKMLAIWKKDTGREEIMKLWRCFAYGIGNPITIKLPQFSISGHFVGVDDFGYLLLEEKKGCFRKIFTGDIFI
ncbi:birA bifunctional protein [Candidatus Liberibacter solanacearum CLso-ZC1]|uniref:biotin--[biotin carboxyl-carrier protein] ligase n=1 Tax=Liberibacter solanacearum (strain CLso-ZC1) TaxID=658172 RepID=E4UDN4_LIBSC|nr:biotin--[acetyl-CoA-carboxylase] ligase [Candidatus Liberibacter solanacearum]ADR52712.1 birA bifunctional protein [Candidatus Liberibacter solanacearum CLso-ZC1]